jgi:hypothetical protein
VFLRSKERMIRRLKAACLILCQLALPCQAQARHWYTDARWWVGESVIAVSIVLDGHSTCRAVSRGAAEVGPWGWFIGNRPSCLRIKGIVGAEIGAMTLTHISAYYFSHGSVFGRAIVPSAAFAMHVPAAFHNYKVAKNILKSKELKDAE